MPATLSPSLGLVFDKPPIAISSRALSDGKNFRLKNGIIESVNLGWVKFSNAWVLNGPVRLIANFFPRVGSERLILASDRDLYTYDPNLDKVTYITPVKLYSGAATVAVTNGSATVTGTGTTFVTDGLKAGDAIFINLTTPASYNDPTFANVANGPYTILTVNSNTSLTLSTVYAGTTISGTTMLVRLRLTSNAFNEWSTDTFINDGTSGDDLWFATNGINPVITWNGITPNVISHPELGFTCKRLATYSNMMIYGNIVQNSEILYSTIINSDIGLPLNAGSTGTGLSEQFVVHSEAEPLVAILPLGDYLIIYSSKIIVSAQFVGDPLIFVFRKSVSGYGPISSRAVADFGNYHEFLSTDAGYTFDGASLKETNSHVWRNILRQADPARRDQVYHHFDEEQGDLIWSIPGTTDAGVGTSGTPPAVAWPEHYLENVGDALGGGSPFSKRDFPFTTTGYYERKTGLTWAGISSQWKDFNFSWDDQFYQIGFPLNLAGDINGQIWIVNQSQQANGSPLASFVRTKRMTLQSGRERGLLSRIYPFSQQRTSSLEVSLYMSDFVGGGMELKDTQTFDLNLIEGKHFVTFYRKGRAMEFMFGSSVGNPWSLSGWDYDTTNGGRR